MQFIHAEKMLGMFPVVNDSTVAALFGITAEDYRAIRDKISGRAHTAADVIWFTPTGILEEKIARHWMLGNTGSSWLSADVARVVERIRAIPETVVDLTQVFGEPPRQELLLEDELHPSLSGHKLIVKELIDVLAAKS